MSIFICVSSRAHLYYHCVTWLALLFNDSVEEGTISSTGPLSPKVLVRVTATICMFWVSVVCCALDIPCRATGWGALSVDTICEGVTAGSILMPGGVVAGGAATGPISVAHGVVSERATAGAILMAHVDVFEGASAGTRQWCVAKGSFGKYFTDVWITLMLANPTCRWIELLLPLFTKNINNTSREKFL